CGGGGPWRGRAGRWPRRSPRGPGVINPLRFESPAKFGPPLRYLSQACPGSGTANSLDRAGSSSWRYAMNALSAVRLQSSSWIETPSARPAPASEPPWYSGITRYQWLVLLLASLGWVFDIYEGQVFVASMNEAMPELLPAGATAGQIAFYNNLAFGAF